MTKKAQSLWILGTLALALSAAPLYAQQNNSQSSSDPSAQSQQQQQPANGSGMTNVDAAAGPLSPNSTNSMSPENAMATMLRSAGGVNNAAG